MPVFPVYFIFYYSRSSEMGLGKIRETTNQLSLALLSSFVVANNWHHWLEVKDSSGVEHELYFYDCYVEVCYFLCKSICVQYT